MLKVFNMRKKDCIYIIAFFLVALILRLAGINWGITHNFQPDEKKLVYSAVTMVQDGAFYHNSFIYPNQTIVHVAAVMMKMFANVPVRRGDVFEFYVIFRALVAVIGSFVVPMSYLLGNYVKRNMGPVLAVLVCLFPPYINYSKQVTGDMVVLFYCLALIIFSVLYYETGKNIFLPIMSLFAALATMEKWHGAAITLNIAFIVLIVSVSQKSFVVFFKAGIIALFSYILSIIAISPHVFSNFDKLLEDLIWVYITDDVYTVPDFSTLMGAFSSYFGIITVIILIFTAIYIFNNRLHKKNGSENIKLLIISVGGIINYVSIGLLMNRMFERWGLEFYFSLLVVLAYFVTTFFIDNKDNRIIKILCGGYSVFLFLLLVTGAARIVATAMYSYNDTRLEGEGVFAEIGITMDNSVYEGYTVFSPGGIRDYSLGGTGQKEHQMDHYIYLDENDSPHVRHESAKYAVTSSMIIKNRQMEENILAYKVLEDRGKLLKVIQSDYPDLFDAYNGTGAWNKPDYITILRNIKVVYDLMNGAASGPEIRVYDISDFVHDA